MLLLAATAAAVVVHRLGSHRHEPPDKRRRLGVETQARLATTRDLRPLLTRQPEPDRFVLARWGRQFLSTEGATGRGRRCVRGAVAVFGPSQSGKTTGLVDGVGAWVGPAVVSSVKTDLLRATVGSREQRGEVKVFDPLGVTGMPSASWSPLRAASGLAGALAAAQVLARAGAEEAPNDRFWRGQAEQLIAAMLWTAANTEGHTMRNVVRWVLELDRPQGDDGGTLAPLVRLLTDHPDPATALAARQVQGWLHGQWSTDPRTTSSVYATARNAVWPWADPAIAATADGCDITLDWLLADANTLYLSAPLGDETRIGIVFAVLLHDLITQAFDRYNRTGEVLDPRLLVLLDEAANTPLPEAPAVVIDRHRRRHPARHRLAVEGPARHHLRQGRRHRPHEPPLEAHLPERHHRPRHRPVRQRARRRRARPQRPRRAVGMARRGPTSTRQAVARDGAAVPPGEHAPASGRRRCAAGPRPPPPAWIRGQPVAWVFQC